MLSRSVVRAAVVIGLGAFPCSALHAALYEWNGAAYNSDWYGVFNFSGPFWSNNWGKIGLALPLPTPQSGDDALIGSAFIAELSAAAHVRSLELADTAQFVIKAGADLTIDNSLVVAEGAEFRRDTFSPEFKPPQVIYNSGTVRLDGYLAGNTRETILRGTGAYYMGSTIVATSKLTVATGATLTAFDTMFSATLENYGVIDFVTGAPSAIHDNGGYNYGDIRLQGSGQFYLRGNLNQADTATLTHVSGTTVIDEDGVWISGGRIIGGAGKVYSPGYSWHLDVLENGALIDHRGFFAGVMYLERSLSNTGTIKLKAFEATSLQLTGDRTINGTGKLQLDGAQVTGAGYTLTNGTGHTIEAASGTVQTSLTNNGLVTSNVSAQKLTLSGPMVLNDGTISAMNGSLMDIGGTGRQVVQTTPAIIIADASAITFKAGTAVSGGTVKATNTGSVTAETGVTFTGVTLTGNGQFNGVTNLYGGSQIVPGNSIGTLSFATLNIMGNVTYKMEYGSAGMDSLTIGDLNFAGGHLLVELIPLDGAPLPATLTLLNYRTLSGAPDPSDISILGHTYTRLSTDGSSITLYDVSVPEPGTIALASGVILLLWQRRRCQQRD